MSTDKNWFDDYLKAHLARDLIFRSVIWSVISASTFLYASAQPGFTGITYLKQSLTTLLPLMTNVLSLSLVLLLAALLFKDLEDVSPERWGQASPRGMFGGVVRRIAGDLSLWVIGAMVTICTIIVVTSFQIRAEGAPAAAVSTLRAAALIPVVGVVAVGTFNVWVRQAKPLLRSSENLAKTLDTPGKVIGAYSFLVIVVSLINKFG